MLGRIWHFVKNPVNFAVIMAIAGGGRSSSITTPETKPGPPQNKIEADCGSVAIVGRRPAVAAIARNRRDKMCRIFLGLDVVLAFVFAGPGASAEERPLVHAEQGSVAIVDSNATGATISIGVPYEKLEAAVRSRTKGLEDLSASEMETIALLKEKLDLNQRQVTSALEIIGEANVPPEQLGAKLLEIAAKYKDLQTAAAAQPGDDAKITALKAEAQKAIQDGQLGKADDLLAAIEKIQTEALDRLALNAAQITAQRGDVALTRLRYPEAAQRYAEAAAKVPQGHDDERWKYLNAEAPLARG